MRRAMGVVISGLRRSIWLSWSKSLYEASLRPGSSITSEYSSAGVRTSLNPNSLKRPLMRACASSNRVDSGGNTSRVPGVVANFLGVSRSIGEAILTDALVFDGPGAPQHLYRAQGEPRTASRLPPKTKPRQSG